MSNLRRDFNRFLSSGKLNGYSVSIFLRFINLAGTELKLIKA